MFAVVSTTTLDVAAKLSTFLALPVVSPAGRVARDRGLLSAHHH